MDAETRPRRARQKIKASARKKPALARPADDNASKKLLRAELEKTNGR